MIFSAADVQFSWVILHQCESRRSSNEGPLQPALQEGSIFYEEPVSDDAFAFAGYMSQVSLSRILKKKCWKHPLRVVVGPDRLCDVPMSM